MKRDGTPLGSVTPYTGERQHAIERIDARVVRTFCGQVWRIDEVRFASKAPCCTRCVGYVEAAS